MYIHIPRLPQHTHTHTHTHFLAHLLVVGEGVDALLLVLLPLAWAVRSLFLDPLVWWRNLTTAWATVLASVPLLLAPDPILFYQFTVDINSRHVLKFSSHDRYYATTLFKTLNWGPKTVFGSISLRQKIIVRCQMNLVAVTIAQCHCMLTQRPILFILGLFLISLKFSGTSVLSWTLNEFRCNAFHMQLMD